MTRLAWGLIVLFVAGLSSVKVEGVTQLSPRPVDRGKKVALPKVPAAGVRRADSFARKYCQNWSSNQATWAKKSWHGLTVYEGQTKTGDAIAVDRAGRIRTVLNSSLIQSRKEKGAMIGPQGAAIVAREAALATGYDLARFAPPVVTLQEESPDVWRYVAKIARVYRGVPYYPSRGITVMLMPDGQLLAFTSQDVGTPTTARTRVDKEEAVRLALKAAMAYGDKKSGFSVTDCAKEIVKPNGYWSEDKRPSRKGWRVAWVIRLERPASKFADIREFWVDIETGKVIGGART